MKWAGASAIALLSLVVIAGAASAQVINSPGRYDATVVVLPELTPPGLPQLGPNAYAGEVNLVETGNGWNVSFRGETDSGDQLHIQAKFDSGWSGLTLGTLPGGGLSNVVIGMDVDNLESAHVNGVGLVDGQVQRVNAKIGPGGSVEDIQIH